MPSTKSSGDRSRYALSGILLVAFALRMFWLNERGLWYDEAFTILYASRSFAEMLAGTLTRVGGGAADVHPLFYYFLIHLWSRVAGDSVVAVRFYSVFWGIAALPIVFHLARDLFGSKVGLTSTLILSIAPFHLAYSQEARMYAQLGVWSALAFLGFVRYARTGELRWWLLFVAGGVAALYSHNLSFLSFVALGLWVVADATRRRSTTLLGGVVLGGLAMLVLWLPWLVFVPGQLGRIEQAYWVPVPSLVTFFQTLLVFAFDFDNATVPRPLLLPLLLAALLLPALVALELARQLRQPAAAALQERLVFSATMAIVPVALLFGLSQWRPVYIIRALMPAFIWYVILVGWMVTRVPRGIRLTISLGLIGLIGILLPAYYTFSEFPRSPFKQAIQSLRAHAQPGDAIVHDNKLSFFPMHYYNRELPQVFLADPAGAGSDTLMTPTQQALGLYPTTLEAATAGASRVWLVIFQAALDERQGEPHPNLTWMGQNFRCISLDQFNDLNVYLFER